MSNRTHGANLLARVDVPQTEIAARLGVSNGAVAHWVSGFRTPDLPNRKMLLTRYKIPIEAWDQPANEEPSSGPDLDWGDNTVAGRIAMLDAMYRDLARRAHEERTETPLRRLKLLRELAGTALLIRKLRGDDVPESMLLEHPAVTDLLADIVAELKSDPAVLRRVLDRVAIHRKKAG